MTVDLSDSGSGIDETSIAVTVDDGTTTHLSSVGTGDSHVSYSNGTVTIDPTATTSFKLADGTTTATVDVGDNVGNTASTNWSFAVDAGSADGSTDWETPPEAPTNVSTNYIYEGYVDLSWTASTSSDVDGYRVYRNTSNDFSTAQELTSYVNPNTYWKDSTVATGTTYYYWVVAYDTEGLASDPSSVVSEAPIALETVFTNNGSAATGGGNSWGPELGELYYASDGKNLYLKLTWTTVGAGNKVYLAIDDQNQTSGVSTTGWGNLRVDLSSASFDADGVLWGARDGGGEFTTSGFNAITSGSETDKQSAITVDQNGDYSEYTIKIPYYAIGAGASSSNSIQVAAFFGKSVPNGGIHSSVPAPTSTTTGWLFSADVTDYSIAVDDNNLVRLIGGMNSWSTTNTDYSLVNQGNGVYNNMFVDGNVTSGQEFKWYISRDGGSNWEYQPGGSNPNLSVADSTTEVSKITGWIRSLDSASEGTIKLDAKNQSNNSVERSVSISSNSASTSFSGLDATVFDAKLAVAGVDVPNLDVDFTIEEAKALPGRNVVADIAVDSSVDPTTANVQINTVDIDEIVEEDNLSHPDTADIKTEIGSLNQTMLQAFYWEMDTGSYESNYPGEANLWRLIESRADDLSDVGITSLLK